MFHESVTLINRTKRVLKATFDGHEFHLQPGPNHGFPKVAVRYAKEQNPRMGTQHPNNPTVFESLVGVAGTKDRVDPIEDEGNAIERIDRSKMVGIGRKAVVMEGDPVTAFEARVSGIDTEIDGAAIGSR